MLVCTKRVRGATEDRRRDETGDAPRHTGSPGRDPTVWAQQDAPAGGCWSTGKPRSRRVHALVGVIHIQICDCPGEAGSIFARVPEVNGRACDNDARLDDLIGALKAERRIDPVWKNWADLGDRPQGTLASQVSRMRDIANALKAVVSLGEASREFLHRTAELGLAAEPGANGDAIDEWRRTLNAVQASKDHAEIESQMNDVKAALERLTNPLSIVGALLRAVAERDPLTYEREFEELLRLTQLRRVLDRRDNLHNRLTVLLPMLAYDLEHCDTITDCIRDKKSFSRAFRHAQARTWLDRWCDPERYARAASERDLLENAVKETMVSFAAAMHGRIAYSALVTRKYVT